MGGGQGCHGVTGEPKEGRVAGPRQTREAQGERRGRAGREEPPARVHICVVVACL